MSVLPSPSKSAGVILSVESRIAWRKIRWLIDSDTKFYRKGEKLKHRRDHRRRNQNGREYWHLSRLDNEHGKVKKVDMPLSALPASNNFAVCLNRCRRRKVNSVDHKPE